MCVRVSTNVCLCVLFYICPQPDSRLEGTPISPVLLVPTAFALYSWQCEEEIWLILGRSLSSHPSHISPFLAVSLSSFLSLHQLCVCVPGFLALTSWLGSHSGTVAPRPKQGLMSNDTLFSPFPLWAYNRRTVYGHSSVFIVLGMLIVFLQLRIHTIRLNRDNLSAVTFFLLFLSLRPPLRFPLVEPNSLTHETFFSFFFFLNTWVVFHAYNIYFTF